MGPQIIRQKISPFRAWSFSIMHCKITFKWICWQFWFEIPLYADKWFQMGLSIFPFEVCKLEIIFDRQLTQNTCLISMHAIQKTKTGNRNYSWQDDKGSNKFPGCPKEPCWYPSFHDPMHETETQQKTSTSSISLRADWVRLHEVPRKQWETQYLRTMSRLDHVKGSMCNIKWR